MEYWLTRTGIGISFGLAAFLGLLVGLAVVAQTLYASVTERTRSSPRSRPWGPTTLHRALPRGPGPGQCRHRLGPRAARLRSASAGP